MLRSAQSAIGSFTRTPFVLLDTSADPESWLRKGGGSTSSWNMRHIMIANWILLSLLATGMP